jgi:hypothetical protein
VNDVNLNKKVLLYVIRRLKERGTFFGKLQVMKLMFLIDHLDVKGKKEKISKESFLGNEYIIYHFGPFSFKVSEEYDMIKDEELKNEVKLDEKIREKVDLIIDKFGKFDGWTLQEKCMEMLGISLQEKGRFMGLKMKEILKN